MYESVAYVKFKLMVQATPINPTVFVQIPLHYSVTSHVIQFRRNVYTRIEAGLTNGRKRIAWDDVTKHFLFHKAAILTNLVDSFKHGMLNMQLK